MKKQELALSAELTLSRQKVIVLSTTHKCRNKGQVTTLLSSVKIILQRNGNHSKALKPKQATGIIRTYSHKMSEQNPSIWMEDHRKIEHLISSIYLSVVTFFPKWNRWWNQIRGEHKLPRRIFWELKTKTKEAINTSPICSNFFLWPRMPGLPLAQ